MAEESLIAVFIDFENLALGVRETKAPRFDIELVLKRLLEKGRIVYKRAYCDWSRYSASTRDFHAHGIELVDIPRSKMSGKNSADIRMVVDALDLSYSKSHIDTFALLSGDSDFSPLAAKLKENEKRVIGCGVKKSTSDLLVASCDGGDVRPSPDGVFVYSEAGKREILLGPGTPRHGKVNVIDELCRAVLDDDPLVHDGPWGRATLEVCLAILQSARERREVYLSRQTPVQ